MGPDEKVRFLGALDKRCITCTVMSPQQGGRLTAQLIFDGKTTAVLPAASPETVLLSASESHWATTETLVEVLKWHERTAVPEGAKWLVALDVAPVHVSAATRERLRAELPRMTLCFVPARKTSFLQPLGVAVMGPFKGRPGRLCATEFAADLFSTLLQETAAEPAERTKVDTRLSALKRRIPTWVGHALERLSAREDIRSKAWRHLHVEEGIRSALLEEAKQLHSQGKLMGDPKPAESGAPHAEPAAEGVAKESSDSDLCEEQGGEPEEVAELTLPTPSEMELLGDLLQHQLLAMPVGAASASASDQPASSSGSGKKTVSAKEASYARLASACLLRKPPAHWTQ